MSEEAGLVRMLDEREGGRKCYHDLRHDQELGTQYLNHEKTRSLELAGLANIK